MTVRVVQILGAVLVFLGVLTSVKPGDIILGALIAVPAVLAAERLPRPNGPAGAPSMVLRLLWLPLFAAAVLWDVAIGTWDVTLRVLGLRAMRSPGIVLVPIGERSEAGTAISALALTLSPGSLLLDVDRERGVMLVHEVDASDPEAVRARHQRFYERFQRRVFP